MIYFIENTVTKSVKIGYAASKPQNRARLFQTGNEHRLRTIGVMEGDRKQEAALHRRFADRRINPASHSGREWFRGDDELLKQIDYLIRGPVTLFHQEIKGVYLAGKISGNSWRDNFLVPLPYSGCTRVQDGQWLQRKLVCLPNDPRKLDFLGPFWFDLSEEHKVCTSNEGIHGFAHKAEYSHCGTELTTEGIFVMTQCFSGVRSADLVFAWIDSVDCYGTLAEIGMAYACKKHFDLYERPIIAIAVANTALKSELWFACAMADFLVCTTNPVDAWERLWSKSPNGLPVGSDLCADRYLSTYAYPYPEYADSETEDIYCGTDEDFYE